jgi:hypothetical protein
VDSASHSKPWTARLIGAGVVLFAALALMWTALVDHRPSVFYDSESYHLQGGRFAQALGLVGPKEAARLDAEETPEQRAVNDTLLGARSPFYGLFFYASERTGTLWLTAFCQCLAAAWGVRALLKAAAPRAGPVALGAALLATAGLTSLPFFASFVLPDVFAGLGLLAAVTLLVYADRLKRGEQAGLWLLIAAACAFHQSNLPTIGVMAVAGGLALLAARAGRAAALRRGGLVLSAAIAAAIAGQAFLVIHKARTGETLRRPPFLAVRMLADGPGRDYLRQACAHGSPYELCRYKALPLDSSEDMLWSEDPAKGIMNVANHDQRVRLEDQETAFVLGVVTHRPLQQLAASLRNWSAQLGQAYVEEPLRDPTIFFGPNYFSRTSLPRIIPNNADCRPGGAGCKPRFDVRGLAWLHQGVLLAALGFVGWRLTRRDGVSTLGERPVLMESDLGRLCLLMVLVVAGLLVNAAVCGALSGVFPRYQARVIWLAPLMACAVALALGLAPGWQRLKLASPHRILSRSQA